MSNYSFESATEVLSDEYFPLWEENLTVTLKTQNRSSFAVNFQGLELGAFLSTMTLVTSLGIAMCLFVAWWLLQHRAGGDKRSVVDMMVVVQCWVMALNLLVELVGISSRIMASSRRTAHGACMLIMSSTIPKGFLLASLLPMSVVRWLYVFKAVSMRRRKKSHVFLVAIVVSVSLTAIYVQDKVRHLQGNRSMRQCMGDTGFLVSWRELALRLCGYTGVVVPGLALYSCIFLKMSRRQVHPQGARGNRTLVALCANMASLFTTWLVLTAMTLSMSLIYNGGDRQRMHQAYFWVIAVLDTSYGVSFPGVYILGTKDLREDAAARLLRPWAKLRGRLGPARQGRVAPSAAAGNLDVKTNVETLAAESVEVSAGGRGREGAAGP